MLLAARCVPGAGAWWEDAPRRGPDRARWIGLTGLSLPIPFPPSLSSSRPAASLRAVRSAVAAAPTLRRAPTALRAVPPRATTARAMASSAAADWAKTVRERETERWDEER